MITRRRIGSHEKSSPSGGWSFSQLPSLSSTRILFNGTESNEVSSGQLEEDNSSQSADLMTSMNSACRDRTVEFQSVVKSLKSRQSNGGVPHKAQNNALKNRSEFSTFAKRIGRDISKTYEKLEKLTLLCKKRSLFDDRPVEIQELTYIIKQDITSLKKQIAQLEQVVSARSSGHKDIQKHSSSIVRTLRSKLASMSDNFKSVLEVRRENMKQQKLRKDQFSTTNLSSSMPPSAMQGNRGSVLIMDEQRNSSGDVSISMDGSSPSTSQDTMQLLDQQDAYIQERASTMETIESTIVELGTIFQQLATMVKEQEEQIMRIDSNVEESELNIEAAHGEILKYFQSVTSNRWLMAKIFLTLIAFFIIFVVFFA
ncbi:syntaxin-5-like [Styela clava]|uniref:syntaxin-5-like n=1 Tax=Styela clava TaxID=7725 RepID=UPI0019392B31|nr:syntaxin-5-like [Styela clava]